MENLNFYKDCKTCEGQGKVIINGTPNNDPRHDEIIDCIECDGGKVSNDELLRERFDEYSSLLDALRDKIIKIENTIENVKKHRDLLYNKASGKAKRYFK